MCEYLIFMMCDSMSLHMIVLRVSFGVSKPVAVSAYWQRTHNSDQVFAQVCDGFKFDLETTSAAVQYFDRLLCEKPIAVNKLQITALVCIWTASKMLESQPLRSKDLTRFFSSFATVKECREIEMDLLVRGLQWRTSSFTAIAYCRALLRGFLPQMDPESLEEDLKKVLWAIEYGKLSC